ncbi:hypothetical protein RN001_012085 [Aquatica leii]|uniref:CHK kinase-like domain-containing protein n=1 Tax=Aquatica leii TaxID=1421715 RepID=A0AAN7P528_9COLE|nr:hypothetical protein RN001_012085 [Aquatica leii]
MGVIAKVEVTGIDNAGNNLIRNFVIKSAPTNEMMRSQLPIHIAYQREAYMYTVVLPEFNKLQLEKKILKPFTSLAKHYKSFLNNRNEAIILEDMKAHGFYSLLDRKQPLNYEHEVFILREYGKLHALSFAMRLHKPKTFNEIANNTQEQYFCNFNKQLRIQNYKNYSAKAYKVLDPIKDKNIYDKYNKFHEKIDDIASEITNGDVTNPYYVIRHGDCWINNFLFKYEDEKDRRSPIEICFLDWQMACFGSPALDLSYFIFTSTDKRTRDKYYDKLLKEYYDSFSSFLKEFGGDPDKQFSFDTLKSHMKQYGIYGLIWSIMILFVCTSDGDDIPDIQASSNVDDVIAMENHNTKHLQLYNSRIRDVITDVERLGFDHF